VTSVAAGGPRSGEADRFARQRLIPGWDQRTLSAATVVLVGVGALGNEVAKNLALAGLGRLVLCDPDVVSVSNLSRTVLFGAGDVDTPKATAAAAALRRLAPGLHAEPRVADLVSGVGLGELAAADLVIGCVDTIRARIQLLGRCALVDTPLLDGGTSPWGAELRLRISPAEACFCCTLSLHQRSVSDLPWSCAEPLPHGAPEPSAIGTTAVAGGWLCSAALSLLFGRRLTWRLLSLDITEGRAAAVSAIRDPQCPLHRPIDGPVVASPVGNDVTVEEFLRTIGPDDEAYTWTSFPMAARCMRCGQEGGSVRCSQCGAALRERSSTRLRDAMPGSVLSTLGIAPEEMIPVSSPSGALVYHRLASGSPADPPRARLTI
jgi:molybdopterin-synthase adenylyltransferase